MLRVVLPLSSLLVEVRLIVIVLVVIVYVLVVDVDVDVAVSPSTTPAPAPTSPGGADRNPGAERQKSISRRVVDRRIRIDRRTIDHGRVVRGDVNDLRIGQLNHDHILAFDRLAFHFLLLARF
jgi:hypothetical protein